MKCEMDFKHSPVWCDACWSEKREVEALKVNRAILEEYRKYNELKEWELEQDGRPRPVKPIHRAVAALEQATNTPAPIKRRGL